MTRDVRDPTGDATEGIAVIGLGLIGGSIARDLAAAGVAVTGVDRDPAVLRRAAADGVLRHTAAPGEPLPSNIGLVVVAAPVPAIPAILQDLARGGAMEGAPEGRAAPAITDVASTKSSVMAAAAEAGLSATFVGGHPMTGDHHSGWEASRSGLFQGATVWLCPGEARSVAVARVTALWTGLGARPSRIDAARHDRLVAFSSHLPQAAASALAAAMDGGGLTRDQLGPGGGGAIRLAGSDPDLWTGILLDNAPEVAPALEALGHQLDLLRQALLRGDAATVRAWLTDAARWAGRQPSVPAEP